MRTIRIVKDGKTPHTNSEWFEIAPPAGKKKQWKPYHSASELADYFLHYVDSVPPEIDNLLNDLKVKSTFFECIPEAETYFPVNRFNRNGPRNHDLLMIGEDVVIGLEAKATEDLDKDISVLLEKATPTQKERYTNMCLDILGRDISQCGDIKYQLLSATLGTLLEAQKRNIKKAILLVVLFDSKIVPLEHIESTKKDIKRFTDMLSPKGDGPYHIPYMPEIDFYVKFIRVSVCSYCDKK